MQTLTWDAWNRLIQVTERNVTNDGYDWSAVYDGLGRRLQTTHQPIVAGSASGASTVIASLYDPEAEFLEVGVVVNGTVSWKVHGPDLDGRLGGWNGTGGLEAVLTADPESAIGAFKVKAVLTDNRHVSRQLSAEPSICYEPCVLLRLRSVGWIEIAPGPAHSAEPEVEGVRVRSKGAGRCLVIFRQLRCLRSFRRYASRQAHGLS